MVKLLFLDMDGAGANSWNGMDEAGYDLPENCRFFQTGEKKGLTATVADKIIAYFNAESNKEYKVLELTKHCRIVGNNVFFLKGPFSQWWQAEMEEDGIVFNCCEQYMMYRKAMLFGDEVTAQKILAATEPREQKRLGRIVRNFRPEIWDKRKKEIVFRGNFLKFTGNESLKQYLLSTGDLILAEANKHDRIWGIGMFSDDRDLLRTELWGENLLGKILMQVREKIRNG